MPPDGSEKNLSEVSIHRAMQEAEHLEPRSFCIELHPPSHRIVKTEEYTAAEVKAVANGMTEPNNSAGSKRRKMAIWDREQKVSHQ